MRSKLPLRRFDKLFTTFERPALCKIDVQGAELMVLEGMTGCLSKIDALIVETSTIATVKGGAELGSVVSSAFLRWISSRAARAASRARAEVRHLSMMVLASLGVSSRY